MIIEKFSGHENANAYKVYTPDFATLISYTTPVVEVSRVGWLRVNGLYSATTRKHISWFMRELGFTYQLAKQLYEAGELFNIYTGEIIPA